MQKITVHLFIILFSLFLILPFNVAHADACPSGTTPTDQAVCDPASQFFVDLSNYGKPNTFAGLLLYIVEGLLGLVGILSVAFIVIGGFQYITSAGNEEQAETGKKTLTNAIIGLVIVILSYIIVTVIINALKGQV